MAVDSTTKSRPCIPLCVPAVIISASCLNNCGTHIFTRRKMTNLTFTKSMLYSFNSKPFSSPFLRVYKRMDVLDLKCYFLELASSQIASLLCPIDSCRGEVCGIDYIVWSWQATRNSSNAARPTTRWRASEDLRYRARDRVHLPQPAPAYALTVGALCRTPLSLRPQPLSYRRSNEQIHTSYSKHDRFS